MNGHNPRTVKNRPGNTIPGTKTEGTVTPKIVGSNEGNSLIAPSSHPMYQSGCAGALTVVGSNGPYSQIGLICTRPPITASKAAVNSIKPVDLNTCVGQKEGPMTLRSVLPGPGNCVCFCRHKM